MTSDSADDIRALIWIDRPKQTPVQTAMQFQGLAMLHK